MTRRQAAAAVMLPALALLAAGCERQPEPPARTLRLATTTSTENSGLLDELLPAFRRRTGIDVHVLPMGTGRALRTARDGNCDVVLVHAPEAEAQFVRDGWGVNRSPVMYNDFVILGPAGDPAGVRACRSAAEAFKAIASAEAAFVSRGDESGTHVKEMALWRAAEVGPSGQWYRSVGKGMGQTLTVANEMLAYVLADRGTLREFRGQIDLAILLAGDPALHNPYAAIAVNPAKHAHARYDDAMAFIAFLTSDEGRRLIDAYRVDGQVLFRSWPTGGRAPTTRPSGPPP